VRIDYERVARHHVGGAHAPQRLLERVLTRRRAGGPPQEGADQHEPEPAQHRPEERLGRAEDDQPEAEPAARGRSPPRGAREVTRALPHEGSQDAAAVERVAGSRLNTASIRLM